MIPLEQCQCRICGNRGSAPNNVADGQRRAGHCRNTSAVKCFRG
jgi:hypothetical protein